MVIHESSFASEAFCERATRFLLTLPSSDTDQVPGFIGAALVL